MRVTTAEGSDRILSINPVATLVDHRGAHSLPSIGASSVRKENLINLEQGLLVVDEQLQQVILVLIRKVLYFNSVLRQLGQLEQTLLELPSLLGVLLNLLVLLLVHDLVLESPLHDALPDLLDALDKQALQLVLLADLVNFLETGSLDFELLPVDG